MVAVWEYIPKIGVPTQGIYVALEVQHLNRRSPEVVQW